MWEKVSVKLWFSPESRLKFGRTSDFQSTFRLCIRLSTKMVTQYDFSRKQIGFKKLDGKSDEKSHRVTALIIQSLYV